MAILPSHRVSRCARGAWPHHPWLCAQGPGPADAVDGRGRDHEVRLRRRPFDSAQGRPGAGGDGQLRQRPRPAHHDQQQLLCPAAAHLADQREPEPVPDVRPDGERHWAAGCLGRGDGHVRAGPVREAAFHHGHHPEPVPLRRSPGATSTAGRDCSNSGPGSTGRTSAASSNRTPSAMG
jgi:hypothetical protein